MLRSAACSMRAIGDLLDRPTALSLLRSQKDWVRRAVAEPSTHLINVVAQWVASFFHFFVREGFRFLSDQPTKKHRMPLFFTMEIDWAFELRSKPAERSNSQLPNQRHLAQSR